MPALTGPVAPVAPVGPVAPVAPVAPVGPGVPAPSTTSTLSGFGDPVVWRQKRASAGCSVERNRVIGSTLQLFESCFRLRDVSERQLTVRVGAELRLSLRALHHVPIEPVHFELARVVEP